MDGIVKSINLLDPEQVKAELDKLQQLGAIEYYVASDPIGERWVLGIMGQILNLSGHETASFIAGAHAISAILTRRGEL